MKGEVSCGEKKNKLLYMDLEQTILILQNKSANVKPQNWNIGKCSKVLLELHLYMFGSVCVCVCVCVYVYD